MYYYIYQITNLVNNKIYVGVHQTTNLEDGYMGSGKVIRSAINKHGIENFKKDILEFFDTSEAMYAREKEIVTEEFLLREDTYNLRRGGTGGFDYINKAGLNGFSDVDVARKGRDATNKILEERYGSNWKTAISKLAYFASQTPEAKEKNKRTRELNGTTSVVEQMNSVEARAKRKETFAKIGHSQGAKNSQYGSRWIHSLVFQTSRKIHKDDPLPDGWHEGRKMKW